MAKLPFMQFYPADWLQDCQILTLAARGAWQTIICKAWHPSTRGVVSLKLAALSRLFSTTVDQTERVIAELQETGIADIERNGDEITITCRRIVRDWEAAESTAAALSDAGRRGAEKRWGGHSPPNGEAIERLMASQKLEARIQNTTPLKPPCEGGGGEAMPESSIEPEACQKPTQPSPPDARESPSLLSESQDSGRTGISVAPAPRKPRKSNASHSGKNQPEPTDADSGGGIDPPPTINTPAFRAAWLDWLAYRRERRLAAYKPRTINAQLAAFAEWGEPAAIESIRDSIRNNWQGLFPPKSPAGNGKGNAGGAYGASHGRRATFA